MRSGSVYNASSFNILTQLAPTFQKGDNADQVSWHVSDQNLEYQDLICRGTAFENN